MDIRNDSEFRAALGRLSLAQQRLLAARFAQSVLSASPDARVAAAVQTAMRPDAGEGERAAAFRAARGASVESHARCGKEADWLCQAGHFAAKAALASVTPATQGGEPAWEAAMNARMARMAEAIASGEGGPSNEAERQYRILEEYLEQKAEP